MRKIITLLLMVAGTLGISVCPLWAQVTSTNTPTNTPTSTPTNTQTFTWTPAITATACATNVPWGESVTTTGGFGFDGQTFYQKYSLAQSAQIDVLQVQLLSASAGTSIRMGIYNDVGGNPANLIYATSLQVAYPGLNSFYVVPANVNLAMGNYWLAVSTVSGSMMVISAGGANLGWGGSPGDMPNPAIYPGAAGNANSGYFSAYINTCNGFVATTTPLPTDTPAPTVTPTPTLIFTFTIIPSTSATTTPLPTNSPTDTPTSIWTPTMTPTPSETLTLNPTNTPSATSTPNPTWTFSYNNSDTSVAAALGCTVQVVDQVRQLNLDIFTSYMIMRICALCGGCQPSDIMNLRLTMGWDQICAYYGINWTTFTTDLQTRSQTLLPEVITPNQIMRGASFDPSAFPISNPGPIPATLTNGTTYQEACPLCQ